MEYFMLMMMEKGTAEITPCSIFDCGFAN